MNGKTAFALTLSLGFILLTGIGFFWPIPPENVKSIDSAMTALGTALGAAVMALLRNSQADEVRAANTTKALDTVQAALNASPPTDTPQQVQVVNNPDSPVPVEQAP
ncbi:hypothetical protein KFK14_11230 [Sphingobium phenoxybenzoativorans]|uniref:Uncharacterized protein n=1 Tax=Sphingobium phenoxybenzoativorans TaxID=1592790 RepID=A0A975Q3M9_9SPHN|nr:hypothetical protein [Sphingobium phenoxybenzoativorans]QUT07901.1 hypothetical protein KFK14_11230 [Sphingobium phenoxybenzoativorans]